MRRVTALLSTICCMSAASLGAQRATPASSGSSTGKVAAKTEATTPRSYHNPRFGWSVEVPSGWTVDTTDLAYVRVLPPAGGPHGFVGIQAGDVPFPSADSLANLLLGMQARSGMGVEVLARRAITLRDGSAGVELDTELGQGVVGRSHRVITLVSRRAVILDAETYKDAWPSYERDFLAIASSLRVRGP
jgi:hypothetical protein